MIPFKKILFPTDFSANADTALAHAIRLANFDSGEIIVQHVIRNYFEEHPHWTTLFDVHELQKGLDGYISSHMARLLPTESGNIRFRPLISKGGLVDEITAAADREMVDLVVMGSTSGVVTDEIIRTSNRPVLAVSAAQGNASEVSDRKLKTILVATDFSEHSKRVVQYAFDLKRTFDATIYMLHVIDSSHAIEWEIRQGHLIDGLDKMKVWAGNELRNLMPDDFADESRVFPLIEVGSPAETIAAVALKVGADLTVLGTHQHGFVHKHLFGTTAGRLSAKTSTLVLTLKM